MRYPVYSDLYLVYSDCQLTYIVQYLRALLDFGILAFEFIQLGSTATAMDLAEPRQVRWADGNESSGPDQPVRLNDLLAVILVYARS